MTELVFLAATQLARMIRERVVSSVEVVDAYLQQIARYNDKLHAICTLDAENSRQRAQEADEALARGENWGILHGVPITIKDTFETAGLRTTSGYKSLKNYIPQRDAVAVARLGAGGAIILGKTTPGLTGGGDYQGINDIFPSVNNPWNLDYTSGGSSSGSAAAIAAGLSALDLCADFGGSIRQPAHFCGLFGFKPTDRGVPTAGNIPQGIGSIRQMMTVGALARSLEDLRLCLSLIAGADRRQPDIPPMPLDTPSERDHQILQLAWIDELSIFPVATEIKSAMQSAAKKLAAAGKKVERWQPDFDFLVAWQTYYILSTYIVPFTQSMSFDYVSQSLAFLWREGTQGDRELRQLSNLPGMALPIVFNTTLKGYFETLQARDQLIERMDRELEQWDAWLCPVAITSAFTHRPRGTAVKVDGRQVPYMMASGAYTVPFNLTGHPVVVIPIGHTSSGLPIGMQIVGKRWREMELLAVAQKLVEVVGQFQLPPGYSSDVRS